MRVSWLRSALRDLEGQIDFIAERNPGAAERLSRRIREAVDRPQHFPEIGREGRVPSTRELVIAGTRFIVVYRVTDSVEVLRVIHTAQRWPPSEGPPLEG
jgi:toxin ParE1/3/4